MDAVRLEGEAFVRIEESRGRVIVDLDHDDITRAVIEYMERHGVSISDLRWSVRYEQLPYGRSQLDISACTNIAYRIRPTGGRNESV